MKSAAERTIPMFPKRKLKSNPLGALVSSETSSWGTPESILARVRAVLGPIDTDLASSEKFNLVVRAARFFSAENPCPKVLTRAKGVFCNPPGNGALKTFWMTLMLNRKNFEHAVFVAFSLESVYTTQGLGVPSVTQFPHCFPSSRVRYNRESGAPGGSPPRGSLIAYVPGTVDKTEAFMRHFGDLGVCHAVE